MQAKFVIVKDKNVVVVYLYFPVYELHHLDYHESRVDRHRLFLIDPMTDAQQNSHIVAGYREILINR